MKYGIEAIHFDIPKIYVPIEELAHARGIDADKLKLGLGLKRMSFPDVYQDAVVFGANAAKKLIENEKLDATDIHRIYVGTESAVDGSKPIASYLVSLLEKQCFSENALSHVDVVDLTFACIGGVDALQNSIDFVKAHPKKKAIVVCTDVAKYDLKSTGEYTQGAGAIALLVSAQPELLSFEDHWAVSTEGVFDFFKPRRRFAVEEIEFPAELEIHESILEVYKEQPVFDGQYSNQCYLKRTKEAYFRLKNLLNVDQEMYNVWELICMHLPYCYQARRIFTDIYISDQADLNTSYEEAEDKNAYVKSVSKSDDYKELVEIKIAPTERASGQIGNMYTASIFMGLLSALVDAFENQRDLSDKKVGFLAYGSGSKSKAFQATVSKNWKNKLKNVPLFEELAKAQPISISEYEALHQLRKKQAVNSPKQEFYLDKIEDEIPQLKGARYYLFKE